MKDFRIKLYLKNIVTGKIKTHAFTVDNIWKGEAQFTCTKLYPAFEIIESCRFTGLVDRYGIQIYEGDLIRELCGADNYLKSKVVFGIHSIGKDDWGVEHISPMFCKEWLDGSGYGGLNLISSYEVIGNIHQNTELL